MFDPCFDSKKHVVFGGFKPQKGGQKGLGSPVSTLKIHQLLELPKDLPLVEMGISATLLRGYLIHPFCRPQTAWSGKALKAVSGLRVVLVEFTSCGKCLVWKSWSFSMLPATLILVYSCASHLKCITIFHPRWIDYQTIYIYIYIPAGSLKTPVVSHRKTL